MKTSQGPYGIGLERRSPMAMTPEPPNYARRRTSWPVQLQMTDLDALVREWLPILRLHHWTVKATYVHAKDMVAVEGHSPTEVGGQVSHDANFHYAVLRVLYPDELSPNMAPAVYDVEHTIIHELLHLRFPDTSDEAGINATAAALVALKRRK